MPRQAGDTTGPSAACAHIRANVPLYFDREDLDLRDWLNACVEERNNLSSGEKVMVDLAFACWNGSSGLQVYRLLHDLDKETFLVAVQALTMTRGLITRQG